MYRNFHPSLDGKESRDIHSQPIQPGHPHHMNTGYNTHNPSHNHYHNGGGIYENGNVSQAGYGYSQHTSGNHPQHITTINSSGAHHHTGTIQPSSHPADGKGYTTTFYVHGKSHTYDVPHNQTQVSGHNHQQQHSNHNVYQQPRAQAPATPSSALPPGYSNQQRLDHHHANHHIYQQPHATPTPASASALPPGYITPKTADHTSNHIYQQPHVQPSSASTLQHGYSTQQATDYHHIYQQPYVQHLPSSASASSSANPTPHMMSDNSNIPAVPNTHSISYGLEHESHRLASLSISNGSGHHQPDMSYPNNHQAQQNYHHKQQHINKAYRPEQHFPHATSPRQIRQQNRAISDSQLYPIEDEDLITANGSDTTPNTTTNHTAEQQARPPTSVYNQKEFHVIPPPPPLEESVFVGRRDVRNPQSVPEKKIVSEKGTVRGFTNRVRAGIATFWAQPEDQIFLEYNKVLQPKVARNYRQIEKGKIVVYATSMSVVRETSERCKVVRNILQNHMVRYEERDLYMSREMQLELKHRLGQEGIEDIKLPQVFADGIHIGGAGALERMNEAGELRALLESYQKINVRFACERCGGYRFVPCEICHGSKRSLLRNHFTAEFCALRCMHCDENGLRRCGLCKDQQE